MNKNFKIILNYVKDLSIETPDAETLVFVKDKISKYQLSIDIKSKALKNKMIEVSTKLTFKDNDNNDKKSFFEIDYASIVQVEESIKEKSQLEKILLCDVQNEIYPTLEKIFVNLIKESGFPVLNFEKKVDFEELYKKKNN